MTGTTDLPTLDPALASDPNSIGVASLIYGGLVRLDGKLHVQPDGARRWTIARDGREYTFHLRQNLRYPDGRRATAADFASALHRALGPDESAGTASFYLKLIAAHGIRVVDDSTLKISLIHPAAHFLTELAFPSSFVPEQRLVQTYGATWTDHAAGFGPYSVESWRHGHSLVLRPNPHYYGGRPALRHITLLFYQHSSQATHLFKKGGLDTVSGLPAGTDAAAGIAGIQRVPGLALDYLAFNTTRQPFHHTNARWALAAEWSPSLAIKTLGGAGFPVRGFLPSAFGISTPSWKQQLSPQAYLSRAHYNRIHPIPPVVLVMPRDARLHSLANILVTRWQNVLGVRVSVRELNASDYTAVLNAHAFHLAIVRWGADYSDPQDFLGTQLGLSNDNVTGWTTKSYDRYVRLADSFVPNDVRRGSLFRSAVALATRSAALLPLDEPAQTALVSPDLHGIQLTALGTITADWTHVHFDG